MMTKTTDWAATASTIRKELKVAFPTVKFSVRSEAYAGGTRMQRLFLNEANNIYFDAFEQLDWNPSNEFWYYTDVKIKRDDVEEVTLTYKDNEALDSAQIL